MLSELEQEEELAELAEVLILVLVDDALWVFIF